MQGDAPSTMHPHLHGKFKRRNRGVYTLGKFCAPGVTQTRSTDQWAMPGGGGRSAGGGAVASGGTASPLPPSCPGMPGWSLLWATTPLDEKCFPLVCLYCYSRAWVLVAVANGPRLRSALLESQTFPNIPNVRRVSWGLGIGDGGATNVPLHGALALRVTTHTKPGLGVPSVPWGAVWCLRRPSPLVFGF